MGYKISTVKKSECKGGYTQFNIKKINCELMDWFRQYATSNKRSTNQEIILAMEKIKIENEKNGL